MGPFNIQIFTPLVTTHTPFFFPSIYSKASKRVVSFCYPQILFFHSFWNQLRLSLHPHHFTVAIFVKVTIDSILLNLSLISVFSLVIWRLISIWHSHSFILEILSSLGFQDASPLFTLLPVLSVSFAAFHNFKCKSVSGDDGNILYFNYDYTSIYICQNSSNCNT